MKNILGLSLLALLISCGGQNTTTEEKPSEEKVENILKLDDVQLKSVGLTSVLIQEKNITKTIRLNGTIDVPPQNLVSISSALGGYVKSTKLLPGKQIRKGELLVELEDNQFIQLQQDYLTTKAQLQNAEAEYKRQKTLNQSKASSDKVFMQAKSDYEILLVNQKALEEKLRLIHINPSQVSVTNLKRTVGIYAPFDGFVSQVFVNAGKYVSPSDILFELVNPANLMLNLKVFEKDWDKIKVGQTLIAFTNTNPDQKYNAEIALIGKNITEDRTMEVYAKFNGNEAKLIPGLYMNAEITIPENKTMALPQESILSFEGKKYIFEILDKNKFQMLEIQTGNSGGGWVEIINGDKLSGKNIAHKGAYTLLMSLKNTAEE